MNAKYRWLEPKFERCKSYYMRAAVVSLPELGAKLLYSYDTLVCCVDAAGGFHRAHWKGWSRATARHVAEFYRQYCGRGEPPNKKAWLAMPVRSRDAMLKALKETRDRMVSLQARA